MPGGEAGLIERLPIKADFLPPPGGFVSQSLKNASVREWRVELVENGNIGIRELNSPEWLVRWKKVFHLKIGSSV